MNTECVMVQGGVSLYAYCWKIIIMYSLLNKAMVTEMFETQHTKIVPNDGKLTIPLNKIHIKNKIGLSKNLLMLIFLCALQFIYMVKIHKLGLFENSLILKFQQNY
jgi:hypothetical protein